MDNEQRNLLLRGTLNDYNYDILLGWLNSLLRLLKAVLKYWETSGRKVIGLAETLVALTGKHHGESDESMELGLEIVKHMRDFCDKACEETGLNFSLLGTPAEGLAGRFVKMDRKRYGKIPGVCDKEFYTNSSHIPVEFDTSIAAKLSECRFHPYENGGHIFYCELDGDTSKNLDAFEKIVRLAIENNAGYFAINHPVDTCPICGYSGVIDDQCPCCGRHEGEAISIEELKKKGIKTKWNPDKNGMVGEGVGVARLRRITGYLVGTLDRFNPAKKAEVLMRKTHGIVDLDKALDESKKNKTE